MSVDTVDTADAPATHARATVRPDKAEAVAELTEAFRRSSAAVLTEYRGLSVKQVTALRTALGADTTYAVVKNTLTRLAAAQAGLEGLDELLAGPTAVAFIAGEPVEAAKALRDYARANPALVVKGGVLEGRALSADEVRRLADLESREVLLARMAGALTASLSQAVYLFNAPLAQVARLSAALQSKAEQDPSLIGGAGTPVATAGSDGEAGGVPEATVDEGVTPAETDAETDAGSSAAGEDAAAGPGAGPAVDTAADAAGPS